MEDQGNSKAIDDVAELLKAAGLSTEGLKLSQDQEQPPTQYDEGPPEVPVSSEDLNSAVHRMSVLLAANDVGKNYGSNEAEISDALEHQIASLLAGEPLPSWDEMSTFSAPRTPSRSRAPSVIGGPDKPTTIHRESMGKQEWSEYLERMKKGEEEKAKKIKSENEKREKAETKRANPTISKSSRNMVDFGDRDYLERFEEFSSEAKKRLAIKKENAAKEISERMTPEISKMAKDIGPRKVEDWEEWEKIRQKRITMKQEAITKEKAEQEKQFKYVPRINQKSKKLVKERHANVPLLTRLETTERNRRRNKEELIKEETPSHTPKINERSARMHIGVPVHQRLYDHGLQVMSDRNKQEALEWQRFNKVLKPSHVDRKPKTSKSRLVQGWITEIDYDPQFSDIFAIVAKNCR